MAEKIITYIGLSTGLSLNAVITRDTDGFILDSADMTFKAPATVGIAPAHLLAERAIDGTDTQIYEFTDSTTVWNDGAYLIHIYEQAGGAAALNTDRIFASGTLILRGDAIIERSYTFGDEMDDIPVDMKTLIETGANDIIAALGTVVNTSYEGTATGGSNTTVVEALAGWTVDIWASTADIETLCILTSAATGVKYVVKIISNTIDTLTVGAFPGAYTAVAGDTFAIIKNSSAVDIKSIAGTAQTGVDLGVQLPLTNTKLDTLEASLTAMEAKQDTGNTSLDNIDTDTTTIASDTTSIDGKMTDNNTKLDTIESSLTDIETDVEAINTDTTAILADTANIDANVTDILADTANIDTNVGTIATDTTSIDGKMDTVNTNLGTIETDIEATNTALGTVNTNLGTLEDDVEVMTATTPTIYNISIAAADTEYSQALPAHTKAFSISIINGTVGENFRWAFETGKVATPTASYRQIDQEFEYSKDNLDISETIYIAASDVCVAQLEVWT